MRTVEGLLLPFLAIHVVFLVLWIVKLALYGPEQNDWWHFKLVADNFVAGNWSVLYRDGDAINPGYLWLYPPSALYLTVPLASFPPTAAYGVIAALVVAALLYSLRLLRQMAPPAGMDLEWWLAAIVSAPALATLVMGQNSAFMLLCASGSAWLWHKSRPVLAAATMALFAFKPNWGVFFGLFALARGDSRGALTMAAVALSVYALSLPLGTELWSDFFKASLTNRAALADHLYYKQIALKSFFDAVLGQSNVSTIAWAICALGCGALAIAAWRAPGPPVRHIGFVLLLAVTVNPYASFYDALVLVLPAVVWWSERRMWRRTPWLVTGWLIAAIWCWEHYSFTWIPLLRSVFDLNVAYPPFSIVGPAATVWLVLAAREATAAARPAAVD